MVTAGLSLFPARVAFVKPDRTLTDEGYRALQSLFTRVGGALGDFDFDNLTLSGSATIAGTLNLASGTAALPSINWGGNTSTGFYRIAANNVGYSVSGINVLSILSTGLTINGTTTSTSFTGAGTGLTGTASGLTAGNVTTNANLTGMVTSVGNVTTVVTNANLTGPITSTGNATAVASQTGTGSTFVMNTSPTLVTPALGVATATSLQSPIGTVTPNTGAFTTLTTSGNGLIGTAVSSGFGVLQAQNTTANVTDFSSTLAGQANFRFRNTTANSALAYFQNSTTGTNTTDGFSVGVTGTGVAALVNYENANITFSTNNTLRVTISSGGNLFIQTAGAGIRIAEGTNAKQGTAVLVAGVAVVANTNATAVSRIFLTSQVDGGAPGFLRVSTRTASTSFTITSSSATDTSTVAYQIFEPA